MPKIKHSRLGAVAVALAAVAAVPSAVLAEESGASFPSMIAFKASIQHVYKYGRGGPKGEKVTSPNDSVMMSRLANGLLKTQSTFLNCARLPADYGEKGKGASYADLLYRFGGKISLSFSCKQGDATQKVKISTHDDWSKNLLTISGSAEWSAEGKKGRATEEGVFEVNGKSCRLVKYAFHRTVKEKLYGYESVHEEIQKGEPGAPCNIN